MKLKLCLTFLLVCGVQVVAHAEPTLPVDEVTLFPGGATITRLAHVSLGTTQIEIKGLSSRFDKRTLRVQPDAGIQVGQLTVQEFSNDEAPNPREAALEKKIQALRDKEATLDVEAKSAGLVQHYLEGLNNAGAAAHPAAVDAKAMAGVIDTIHHSATESFDSIQKVALQKRELDEQIALLKRDLDRVKSDERDEVSLTIVLNVHQAGTVRVSYQINKASWKPAYRASLDSEASTMELERLATISQSTGEDWRNVKLRLSTVQPQISPDAPDPQPWMLSYSAPESKREYPATEMVTVTGVRATAPDFVALKSAYATQFEVPTRVNLPSDGREVMVTLSAQSLPVKQLVRVAPRLNTNAVVTAVAARPEGVWLNGYVQLFRDGNYVGMTHWNTAEDEGLTFSFGRDEQVRAKVAHTTQMNGTKGLLSKHNERHIADNYTITNTHKAPIEVLVLEAAPVSTAEQVKVESAFLPKPTVDAWEQRQGLVGWQKLLASNEQMKISVDYSISYPAEGTTEGLR